MTKMTLSTRTAAAVSGALLATALMAGTALAAPPAPAPAPANAGTPAPKILVVNRQAILANSKVGQDIVKQARGFMQGLENDVKGQQDSLRKQQQAIQTQGAILAADVRKKKIADFQAQASAYQAKVQSRQMQIQYGVIKARQQVEQAVGPILDQIMKERGANLLLDRQVVVMGTIGNVDITQTVVDRLNQKLPTVKVQPVTPPPEFIRAAQAQQQQGG